MTSWKGLGAAVLAVLVLGCTPSANPGWTYAPVQDGAAAESSPALGNGGGNSGATLGTIRVMAADLSFSPNMVTVAVAGPYAVELTNTGAIEHNITFSDGTAITAQPGKTATATVEIPEGGLSFDKKFFVESTDYRVHQVHLEGGDASSDSYCFP